MRKTAALSAALLLTMTAAAQVYVTEDPVLERLLLESGLLHSPLPVDKEFSFETGCLHLPVLKDEPLGASESDWSFEGTGRLFFRDGGLVMEHPTLTGRRAQGSPDDPDYATYGSASAVCDMHGRDLSGYNRIVLKIYPDCEGGRVAGLNLNIGWAASHLMNLTNREWNTCILDLSEIERDHVHRISLHTTIKGRDVTAGDTARFIIGEIRLQQTAQPDRQKGWEPMNGKIIVSYSGYMPGMNKTAIISGDALKENREFRIESLDGKVRFKGKVRESVSSIGRYGVMDFSGFDRSGEYVIRTEELISRPFHISDRIWDNSKWRVLNFIYAQRCGCHVPGIHGECHNDLFAVHDGRRISYGGGWHDAGDLSQQTLQTGDVAYALLETYEAVRESNPLLAGRLLEEARWGLDLEIGSRFGDGWRASSMGLLHWTDGVTGTYDDITTVRTQNLAFDNFLHAGYEAFAAMTLPDDPAMKEHLTKVAEEDFAFAMEKFRRDGFDTFLYMYEHSYNTSPSQYMATVSWAASQLYRLTGKQEYADTAAESIRYTLDCQRKEPVAGGLNGWFYRDKDRKSIVHYIHQSREQVYMQAMVLLCSTQSGHQDRPLWEESIRLYGGYLKSLMQYTAPYGMIPSGIYHIDEHKDSESFAHLHIFAPEDAPQRYVEQLRKGVQVDDEHYVKRFPVWFNIFNGNTAVHLSMGKAAALCGKHLGDEELMQIAAEQLYWTVGKNPFGQSLIYGEGYDYPQMSSFSSGEITGEMPVGIRTYGDEDIPFWPAVNNACYKEVWLTSAGKWLSLLAEF